MCTYRIRNKSVLMIKVFEKIHNVSMTSILNYECMKLSLSFITLGISELIICKRN